MAGKKTVGATTGVPVVTPDVGMYTAQYEALRARMTTGDAHRGAPDQRARGAALAVLLQQGLPAWLAAVEPIVSMRPAGVVAVRPAVERHATDEMRLVCAVSPDVLPPAQHAEVTLVLAALVLSTARSARRDLSPTHAHASAREGTSR
jgi:hypothetical protein